MDGEYYLNRLGEREREGGREGERERENIQVHVCKKSQQMLEAREKRKDKFLTDFCVNLIILNFMCCIYCYIQ